MINVSYIISGQETKLELMTLYSNASMCKFAFFVRQEKSKMQQGSEGCISHLFCMNKWIKTSFRCSLKKDACIQVWKGPLSETFIFPKMA